MSKLKDTDLPSCRNPLCDEHILDRVLASAQGGYCTFCVLLAGKPDPTYTDYQAAINSRAKQSRKVAAQAK